MSSLKSPKRSAPKASFNVYTMMLIVSFLAICVACTVLVLELQTYDEKFPYLDGWNTKGFEPSTVTSK